MEELDLNLFLDPARANLTKMLWMEFLAIINLLREAKREHANQIQVKTFHWLQLFLTPDQGDENDPNHQRGLYRKEDVTPYMHILVQHVHHLIFIHDGISQFACDGIEQKGHLIQNYFWRCTMKGGGRNQEPPLLTIMKRENRALHFACNAPPPAPIEKRKRHVVFRN